MPKIKLTDKTVKNLKPPTAGQVDYWDAHLPCFGLRIGISGAMSWIVTARKIEAGRRTSPRRFTIGRYPAVPLAAARIRAQEALRLAADGKNPGDVLKLERARLLKESLSTFGAIADVFLVEYVAGQKKAESTAALYRHALKGAPVKDWQTLPIASITKQDVSGLLKGLISAGMPIASNRQLAYLRKFFSWCVEHDHLAAAPTASLKPLAAETPRDRYLTDGEIAEVWAALGAELELFGPLFKVLLLTGQRRDEVAGMRWAELVDLDGEAPTWELPGERTKNRLAHSVPLPAAVVALLKARQKQRIKGSPYVFTTTGETYASGFGRAKERIDRAILEARRAAALAAGDDPAAVEAMPDWRVHDLRRTMVTGMAERGIAPHVIEQIVNHVSGTRSGIVRVYNRSRLIDERRRALTAWAEHVETLASDQLT
jgi:integrase